MQAASKHVTPSLTSHPKDDGVTCSGRSSGWSFIWIVAHPASDITQPCFNSANGTG